MQKKSILRQIIQTGFLLGSLILFLLLPANQSLDIRSANLSGDVSLGIDTGNFNLDIQTGGSSGSNKQPGCEGSNCLTVPDSGTYKGITDLKNIRQAIISWTNFALGFLSLIAMIALIYAGFLYVTAGGEDEPVGKAKKIIIYVVIGIVVIMIAYALVNTLIKTGPSGSDLNNA